MAATAHPLTWPAGWPRAKHRKSGKFGVADQRPGQTYVSKRALSIDDAVKRVRYELSRLGVDVANDAIISTNLRLNLRGVPRGDQGEPGDPGAAIYWQKPGAPMRVMAIDAYTRVADNIGAIAATLEAMRSIERHGGAQILDRAFTGFTAIAAPRSPWDVLGIAPTRSSDVIAAAFREKAKTAHPDAGGSTDRMAELSAARDAALREIGG